MDDIDPLVKVMCLECKKFYTANASEAQTLPHVCSGCQDAEPDQNKGE